LGCAFVHEWMNDALEKQKEVYGFFCLIKNRCLLVANSCFP
jgi:hypothetical protein